MSDSNEKVQVICFHVLKLAIDVDHGTVKKYLESSNGCGIPKTLKYILMQKVIAKSKYIL